MLTALESDYSEQHVKHHMQPPAHRGQLRQYHARSLRYTGNMLGSTMTTALEKQVSFTRILTKKSNHAAFHTNAVVYMPPWLATTE
ncbi:unnamed protein product [Boreogadus saida]